MANQPPFGPRFVIPSFARPPPPPSRPRPPPPSAVPSPTPRPFRPPTVVAPLPPTPPPPHSPPQPAPPIPSVTTTVSSPKSTVNPDSVATTSSDKKPSPATATGGGEIRNAYSVSQTTSPAAKLPSSPHSPVSNSTSQIPTFADHGASITPSSPKVKMSIPPPSPLTLPPPLLTTEDNLEPLPMEAKPKNVTIPENSRHQQHSTIQKGYPELKKDKGVQKKHSEEFGGMSFVTLAGENRGAIMELGKNLKNGLHQQENSTDLNNGHKLRDGPPMGAYINSNVQGVNNSIVYQSSYTHNDPGVHLAVLRKRNGDN